MKKPTIILTVIVCVAAMVSCKPTTQLQRDADMADHITEVNYKGHRYLLYKEGYSHRGYGGIVHDPDCPCHKKGGLNDAK